MKYIAYKQNSLINLTIKNKKRIMLITAFFDGACEPKNPGGNMGMGAIIYKNHKEKDEEILQSFSHLIPAQKSNSSNVAEYLAFEFVIDQLIARDLTKNHIRIYGDSQLVIKQMNKQWQIKSGYYMTVALRVLKKIEDAKFTNLIMTWIPREQNFHADELSKGQFEINHIKIKDYSK